MPVGSNITEATTKDAVLLVFTNISFRLASRAEGLREFNYVNHRQYLTSWHFFRFECADKFLLDALRYLSGH